MGGQERPGVFQHWRRGEQACVMSVWGATKGSTQQQDKRQREWEREWCGRETGTQAGEGSWGIIK